jgi:hypothetical protein
MAKSIQEITFDAVEAFWQSAMDDLGVPMDEIVLGKFETESVSASRTVARLICASSWYDERRNELYDFKWDEFEQLAATLIRALAVEHASIEGETETQQ